VIWQCSIIRFIVKDSFFKRSRRPYGSWRLYGLEYRGTEKSSMKTKGLKISVGLLRTSMLPNICSETELMMLLQRTNTNTTSYQILNARLSIIVNVARRPKDNIFYLVAAWDTPVELPMQVQHLNRGFNYDSAFIGISWFYISILTAYGYRAKCFKSLWKLLSKMPFLSSSFSQY
jgi:hypothetical protein